MSCPGRRLVVCASFASLCAIGAAPLAQARIYTVAPLQTLAFPGSQNSFDVTVENIAIDGDSIIVAAFVPSDPGNLDTLLYRRGSDGKWSFSRVLIQTPAAEQSPAIVTMKNGIAVIKPTPNVAATIWEKSGGDWVQAQTDGPITAPGGFAISQDRVLAGADGCQNDALFYQKNASGIWTITGGIAPDAGICPLATRDVELNYDYALIRGAGNPGSLVRAYRRNGGTFLWPGAGSLTLTGQAATESGPLALQKATAVAPGAAYFHRNGTRWTFAGQLQPIDYAYGSGNAYQVVYRDHLLLALDGVTDYRSPVHPYVYRETAAGDFEQVAILGRQPPFASGTDQESDISGNTAVTYTVDSDLGSVSTSATVYNLPSPIVPPKSIVNNFDLGNVGGFTQTPGSQFALAGNSANRVYRQSSISTAATAVLTEGDWQYFESIEADITPRAFGTATGWAGLAVRYVDANNYYFVTLRNDDVMELKRKVNGVVTTLAQRSLPVASSMLLHLRLWIDGTTLTASLTSSLTNGQGLQASDSSLSHGRAALLTDHTRADFDNLYVTPTASVTLVNNEFEGDGSFPRPSDYRGGKWQVQVVSSSEVGLHQSDTSGTALAINGGVTDDQRIEADVTLDSLASTDPASWIGLVARFVDTRNYYYLSLRSSGRLQIRKVVNGQTFVLKDAPFTPTAGAKYHLTFAALGNELTASVNGAVLARGVDADDSLPVGRFGYSTYRATATFGSANVVQP